MTPIGGVISTCHSRHHSRGETCRDTQRHAEAYREIQNRGKASARRTDQSSGRDARAFRNRDPLGLLRSQKILEQRLGKSEVQTALGIEALDSSSLQTWISQA